MQLKGVTKAWFFPFCTDLIDLLPPFKNLGFCVNPYTKGFHIVRNLFLAKIFRVISEDFRHSFAKKILIL